MSTVLRFADNTESPLASTPEQTTASEVIEGVAGRTVLKGLQTASSETATAESVSKLVSDKTKTSTIKIVTDSVVTGTFDNFTILVGGVTLLNGAIVFTLAQKTDDEISSETQSKELALTQSALFALQAYVAKIKGV